MSEHRQLIDQLQDAARYVTSNPDCSVTAIKGAVQRFDRVLSPELAVRFAVNLGVGCRFIHAVPNVTKGYITGACIEIIDDESKRNK